MGHEDLLYFEAVATQLRISTGALLCGQDVCKVFSAEDFIAALTQHIPAHGFQHVHDYRWYSNKARGQPAIGADGDDLINIEAIRQ